MLIFYLVKKLMAVRDEQLLTPKTTINLGWLFF